MAEHGISTGGSQGQVLDGCLVRSVRVPMSGWVLVPLNFSINEAGSRLASSGNSVHLKWKVSSGLEHASKVGMILLGGQS